MDDDGPPNITRPGDVSQASCREASLIDKLFSGKEIEMHMFRKSGRRGLTVAAVVVTTVVAVAGPAWAPSTIDSRFIKITANPPPSQGGSVNTWTGTIVLNLDAPGVENRLSESRPSDRGDRSVLDVILRDAAGAPLAELSASFDASASPRRDVRTQATVDSSYEPPPTGRAEPVDAPEVRFRRDWHSDARDSSGRIVVANDARLDVRFRALQDGVRVFQQVQRQDRRTIVLDHFVVSKDTESSQLVSVLELTTEQRVESPYTAGPTTVRDNDSL